MEHKEGTFKGLGNLNLYYQCWLPEKRPKAVLLVSHGLAEHSGRYINVVDYFVPKGYAVYALDHRGHGKSEGLRCHVGRFSEFIEDLDTFVELVKGEQKQLKIFLVGHSMGATIAADYAVHYQEKLAGLLVSGLTLQAGAAVSPVMVAIAKILSQLMPKLGVSVLDANAISRDKAVVDAYVNDPLVYRGKVRARLGTELMKIGAELSSTSREIRIPVLIMHGASDGLSDPESSRILYKQASSEDKTLKLYEGLYHEIFNEPERETVFRDMEAWLSAHI